MWRHPLHALPKDTTSELSAYLDTAPLMLNVKKGSCKYQLLKSFGLTRPGNRTQVFRLRGGRSVALLYISLILVNIEVIRIVTLSYTDLYGYRLDYD